MIIPLWQIRMENYTGWSLKFVSGKVWERKPNFNVGKCKVKRLLEKGVKLRDKNGEGWEIKRALYAHDTFLVAEKKRASPAYCE